MEPGVLVFLIGALGVSFYMAFNIGANDLANAMGTSVGSKALTIKRAIILAAVLNFVGAVLVGSRVTETVRKGIVDIEAIGGTDGLSWTVLFGLLSALLAAALWVTIATQFRMPVSTTHSIVGAIMGFGLIAGGASVVNWGVMTKIVASWAVSPLTGAIVAFLGFWLMRRFILFQEQPFAKAIRYAPWLVGLVFGILAIAMVEEVLDGMEMGFTEGHVVTIGLLVGILSGIPSYFLFKRYHDVKGDEYEKVERIFVFLQIITAGYVAFAAGSNDVANAIGPVGGIVSQIRYDGEGIPWTVVVGLLVLGGAGIAIGIFLWEKGVMETIGKRITEITPTRGFTAEFSAATTVLAASLLGLPISTTHTLVGAVIGVGLAGGLRGVDLSVIKKIVISWLVTVPVAALTSILIFLILIYTF